MRTTRAYGAQGSEKELTLRTIERRDPRLDDVAVRVTYCGVCHSDLSALHAHAADGDGLLVPGHEFVGEVVAVGDAVTRFAVGDQVAVGNIVDSCGTCAMCRAGQENFCAEFPTLTYGGRDRHDGSTTLGGYSGEYVVRENFVYHRPAHLDPAAVAPLLCAGVTVWEPLRRWAAGPGMTVGVAGLGGSGTSRCGSPRRWVRASSCSPARPERRTTPAPSGPTTSWSPPTTRTSPAPPARSTC
nr:hypothetical protein GCM10025730_23180 [Promicromonospora thailandica]